MEHIAPVAADPLIWVLFGIVSFAALVGGFVFVVGRAPWDWIALCSSVLAIIGAIFLGSHAFDGPRVEQARLAQLQLEDTYGIELTKSEFKYLNYPVDRPEQNFQVFGSYSRDTPTEDGFARSDVYLIWKNGSLSLAGSTDGKTFTELKR